MKLRMCVEHFRVSLKMLKECCLFALCFEDPLEEYLTKELEAWTAICVKPLKTKSGIITNIDGILT